MRGIGRWITLALVVLAGSLPADAEARTLLVTKVAWVDTAGNVGTMLFQGTVEDGTLAGRAYPGDGTEFVVSGSVAGSGDIAGTLSDSTGAQLGTFTGTLTAQQELEGDLHVDGDLTSIWDAPAADLPTKE